MDVLHIGRNKTGTTALQHFLADHRDTLRDHGVVYPNLEVGDTAAHHPVAEWIASKGPATDHQARHDLRRAFPALDRPRTMHRDRLLLSSEAFQNIAASTLASYFDPDTTTIVVYLREQLDYLVSAWAQNVHGTLETRSLTTFIEERRPDYGWFLGQLVDAFSRDRVVVRTYDKDALFAQDVRLDVLQILGLPAGAFTLNPIDMNPSIGGPLLGIKLLLNQRLRCDVVEAREALYEPLTSLAREDCRLRTRPRVPKELQRTLRRRWADENAELCTRFDLAPFPQVDLGTDECTALRYDAHDLDLVLHTIRAASPDFFVDHVLEHVPALEDAAA